MSPSTPELVLALRAMPSRHAQVLVKWRLEGLDREALGALYGLEGLSLDALLLRASRDLTAALGGTAQAPALPWAEEARLAVALRAQAPDAAQFLAPLEALSASAAATLAALRDAERADEASPARRREIWVRRLAVVAILLLTGYFYLHDHPQTAAETRATVNRFLGTRF